MFAAAADLLRIGKGALLLRSHDEDSFAVWAHRGLDETSRHRLEFPREKVPALVRELSLESQAAADQKIATVAPYLSNLESSMLTSALLIPFPETEAQALFLILDSPYLTDDQSSITLLLAAVGELIIDAVDNSAVRRLRAASSYRQLTRRDFCQRILRHIETSGYGGSLLGIHLQPGIEHMTQLHPELDGFRCFQDLCTLISQVVGTEILTLPEPAHSVWIYVPNDGPNDIGLLVEHLSQIIRSKFSIEAGVELLQHETVELFATATETESQLDSILANVQD